MRPELESAIYNKYPFIFAGASKPGPRLQMVWGIECGDGWYGLIVGHCPEFMRPSNEAEFDLHRLQARPDQDSEVAAIDAAAERLALEIQRIPIAHQIKEKLGTLRVHVSEAAVEHRVCIRFAETLSARICEVCGCPGTLRTRNFLASLCDTHAKNL